MIHGLALCSGIGGIDLGLRMALGPGGYRTVCHVEREAFAAAVLVARMEDKALDLAPIWDDLATFRGEPWRGVVDLVSAGFPCQPWSVAGKRKGTEDERWIWPSIVRIVREVEPALVFVENVPGLYRHGLREVLSDLAALGFDAEWTNLRASDVGAPHRRERLFVLAYHIGGRCYRPATWQCDSYQERNLEASEPCRVAVLREAGTGLQSPWPPGPGRIGSIPRMADGVSDQMDRFRGLGNAVVPAQAAAAFRELFCLIRRGDGEKEGERG